MRFIGEDTVRIEILIEVRNHAFKHVHIIDRLGWEQVAPPLRAPIDPMDAYDAMQKAEKRKRLIDMISSKIAYTLVNAIADKYEKDNK
jgi:hypothetical protein